MFCDDYKDHYFAEHIKVKDVEVRKESMFCLDIHAVNWDQERFKT